MSVYSVIDFVLIVLQLGVYRRHLKKLHAILLELVEKRTLTVLYFDMSFFFKKKSLFKVHFCKIMGDSILWWYAVTKIVYDSPLTFGDSEG